jgi:O-antigen ligase/tetratricopeptide (TPR) repeat protein
MTLLQTSKTTITTTCERLEQVIELLLISLLAFMPLALGAVEAWSEEVVIALAAAISICFMLKLVLTENTGPVWSWAYIPVALFTFVAVLQLLPLPAGLVSVISPNTLATKKELLGDLPNSADLLKSIRLPRISFYPNATKHDLWLVLALAAVFFVVVNNHRRTEQIKRLLAAIAIIGGSIAVLALAQDLFGNGKIYWIIPTGDNQAYSGTFVNHSHYGQFMNLSIGAALGLIMVKLHETFTGKKVTPVVVFEYLSSPAARTIWLLVGIIIIGAATVFVSLTRGGMVSMLIAAAFTTLVLSSRKSLKGRSWIMALVALSAFICVLYIGFDAVYDRLATLRQMHEYKGRWQIVKDIAVAWDKFPLLGTGMGTHEVVYPMFDRSTIPSLAAHAENEYAQAAEETGLIGLVALAGFAIIIWTNYVRNITVGSIPIRSAAYGLGFGLLAIMLHSLSDFGQHLPANAFLSGISSSLLISLGRTGKENNPITGLAKVSERSKGLRITALVCLIGVWVWAIIGANNARLAEARWKQALAIEQTLSEKKWLANDEDYVALISNAAAASDYQPDNVIYRHWLNVYRWRSISRITDPNTGAVIVPALAMEFTRRIVQELNNARLLCPTYGATCCVAGQIRRFILDDPGGAELIRKGFRLAPCDPTACFVAGFMDIEEKQFDASFEKFRRAIELNSELFGDVADIYINHIDRPDLALAIAGDDTGRLSYIANALADTEEHKDIVEKTRARVIELLEAKCRQPDAPAWVFASLANIYSRQKDNDKAIEYYRRALALDYGQVYWRFNLARLLAETDRIPQGIHEARICLRLRPEFKAAEKLIADLSVRPAAVGKGESTP